jgi:hypothetical protein
VGAGTTVRVAFSVALPIDDGLPPSTLHKANETDLR